MVASLYTIDPLEGGLVASCIGGGVCAGQFLGSWIAVPGGLLRFKLIFISCGLCAFVAALAGATHSQATGSALAVCAGLMVVSTKIYVPYAALNETATLTFLATFAGTLGSDCIHRCYDR